MSGEAEEIDAGRLTRKCPTWGTNHITFGPCLKYHTCAHKSGRVRVPPPICSTHCPHPPSWNKPWVTSEEYLSTISCVFIWFNGTIHRNSGITTVDWRAKLKPHDTYQVVLGIHSVPALQYRCRGWSVVIAQWSQH